MGRQNKIKNVELAYIAGFLDGDGSVMIQIKKKKVGLRGWRLMLTICFYQDTRHEKPLFWIKKKLGIGYICRRNDGITELRINGFKQTERILRQLHPYVKFKQRQIGRILTVLKILNTTEGLFRTDKRARRKIASAIFKARQETYQSGKKKLEKLKTDLKKILEI